MSELTDEEESEYNRDAYGNPLGKSFQLRPGQVLRFGMEGYSVVPDEIFSNDVDQEDYGS